jgi:gamma-glutamyltranspeptidase/glutathione hydrolase
VSSIKYAVLLASLVFLGCAAPTEAPAPELQLVHDGPVVYQTAAVAADHPVASEAGAEILRLGGNAVDAAVATSFTLSVVRPYSCGIGGGGFMVIHDPGDAGGPPLQVALNYRETAPGVMGPDYYQKLQRLTGHGDLSRMGPHASGVPGTVAGLLWALEHYGTLDRAAVLAPAIRAAEEGFVADENFVEAVLSAAVKLADRPDLQARLGYIWETVCRRGELQVGDLIVNRQQARVLRLIADRGRDGFYSGPVAEAIVEAMRPLPEEQSGLARLPRGPITLRDLEGYSPRALSPLRGEYRGLQILSMPPPSSGGLAMQQMLALLERRAEVVDVATPADPDYLQLLTEAMKHAFADRAQWLADPDFEDVPVADLLDAAYLDRLAASIDLQQTQDRFAYGSVQPVRERGGTSHLSVVDADGMAVACTETNNLTFGSLVCVPGFGFALNSEMDDFTTIPGQPNAFGLQQSDMNLPAPGKRPLSSMSPTIILEGDRPIIVAGASGGPRIITGTLQCILNCLIFDMTPEEAVDAPRLHHQWIPETLQFETRWTDRSAIDAMIERGHQIDDGGTVGVVQLIRVSPDGIRAASDPRKGGRPAGW